MGILEHHAQGPSQIRLFDLVDVDPVVSDLAVRNVIETVDQIGDRRLACPGSADKSDLLARLCVEADIVQDDLVFIVSEIHIIQHDRAFLLYISNGALRLVGMLPCPQVGPYRRLCQIAVPVFFSIDQLHISIVSLRFLIHQIKDSLRACRRVHYEVDLLADLRDGVGKALIQSHKSHDCTDGNTCQAVDPEDRSKDRHQRVADPADIGIDRHQQVGIAVRLVRTVPQPLIDLMEIPHRRFLMAEDFDDFLPVQHFLDKSVHSTEVDLLADVVFPRQLREIGCDKEHDSRGQKRDDCQHRIQDDHGDQRGRHGNDRVDDLRDALA